MPRSSRCAQLGLAAALVILCAGCGKSWTMNGQVEGTATLDGKPLADVVVEFIPDADPKVQAPISHGTTDEKGHFVLSCVNSKSGAVVGKHNVIIRVGRSESPDGKKPPSVPEQYTFVAKTPLKLEVTADKHTGYDLLLTTKAEPKSKSPQDPTR
jgi:hypothetical protein